MKKIISIYEIISGLGGIILIALSFDTSVLIKLYFSIGSIILFLFVLLSGVLLLNQKKIGIVLSIIFQAIQIINFNLSGVKYVFCSGSRISINLLNADIDFALIVEEFILGVNTISEPFFNVNIIPVIILILLVKIRNEGN